MKTNKKNQLNSVLFYKHFALVQVQSLAKIYYFSSALDKSVFVEHYAKETYTLSSDGNCAYIHVYVIVDSSLGFCLNPDRPLPYYEALDLIVHYE